MEDLIKLSLKLDEQPVVLTDTTGQEATYSVREMAGDDLESYLESNKERLDVVVGENGKMKVRAIKSYKGMYSSLLSFCLFRASGEKVTVGEIDKYPHKVQKALFETAQKLNKIGDEDKGDGKITCPKCGHTFEEDETAGN